jgi:hypothetical protein
MNAGQPEGAAVRIPLLIGVTGHRDLLAEEIPQLRETVRNYLESLRSQHPDVPLRVVTPLSAGADLLVAEEALGLGLQCVAVLPLPKEQYLQDFEDPAELKRFENALSRCYQSFVCPQHGSTAQDAAAPTEIDRTTRYALAGELVASLSFVLIALWDGRPGERRAGTARTVEYRLARRAWTDDTANPAYQDLLPNLPPDLVYHIVVSRRSGLPADGLAPLQQGYHTRPGSPLETRLPPGATLVAERIAEINRRLLRHSEAIANDRSSAALLADLAQVPRGVSEAAQMFRAVDWLAQRMRRNLLRSLYTTSALMVIMGAMFLGYGFRTIHAEARYLIVAFLVTFLILLGLNFTASRLGWHRRHLEFRALAEGLRVDLFWAIAGVTAHGGATAEHRALLKQADPGLDWILSALRAASLSLAECHDHGIPGGVDFVAQHWIGSIGRSDNQSEQLQYYWHAARSKARRALFAERTAGGFVAVGFLLAGILAIAVLLGRSVNSEYLAFVIGISSLIGGVIEALVEKTAERELQRQYQYMHDVFLAAHDRILKAESDQHRRTVLVLLGRAALAENAAWLLVHRDRPVYRSRLQ